MLTMDLSQATYRISEHDFVKASFLNDKPSHRHFAVYGTLIILLTVIYISDFYEMGDLALGVLAGIVLSTLVLHFFGSPYKAKQLYRQYRTLQDEFSIQHVTEGIAIISSAGRHFLQWRDIQMWRQNDDYLLIYPKPRVFYIIPKHIAQQGFDGMALIQDLEQYSGQAR